MKEWLVAYFSFSRKERLGVMVLVVLIAMVWVLPYFFAKPKVLDDGILAKADSLVAAGNTRSVEPTGRTFRLFPFDPNTASAAEWRSLGLRERTIQTIRNYLQKGGRFRRPDDIRNIYGLKEEEAERLIPYVRIAGDQQDHRDRQWAQWPRREYPRGERYADHTYRESRSDDRHSYKKENYRPNGRSRSATVIDLNTADSTALESLPGIGPVLASRIVRFRERAGGFYSLEQLASVYGIKDSLLQVLMPRLTLGNGDVVKLQVNNLSIESLRLHPYIRWQEAKAIVGFRNQHGPFKSPTELLKVHLLDSSWLERILPYLDFGLFP